MYAIRSFNLLAILLVVGGSALWGAYIRPRTFEVPGTPVKVTLRRATETKLPPVPGSTLGHDCNNAIYWDESSQKLFCLTSHEHPYRSSGPDLDNLSRPALRVQFDNEGSWNGGGRWVEAVYTAPSGRLYMWYHNEPRGLFPGHPNPFLTAPRIGQMYSDDNGLRWKDQGIVLEAPAESAQEATTNLFFGGGIGDFSVVPDPNDEYLYFFVSTYNRDIREQGVAMARMRVGDLESPVGQVFKWHNGQWNEPGLGGHVTPIFRAEGDWHAKGTRAFWGPSVHWNSHIQRYVMLMNQGINPEFGQGGIHLSIGDRLDDPSTWSTPIKILNDSNWYPQVVGTGPAPEVTDRLAGRVARLFVKGVSRWEIEFTTPTE